MILMLGQLIEYYIEKIFIEKFSCSKANFGLLHWQGRNLAYSMLITVLYHIWSQGHREPCNEIGFQSLVKHIVGIWTWSLWIWSWSNALAGFPVEGSGVQNHWMAPRLTQLFILSRLMKLVPGTTGDLVLKSELSLRRGSLALRQLNPIHKKEL